MATYRKRGKSWRAEIVRDGQRQSRSFATKALAVAWAAEIEGDILAGRGYAPVRKTLDDALDRYAKEITPLHRGERWETVRLNKFRRDMSFVGRMINDVTPDMIGSWRDARLKEVAPASVQREMNLLSSVFTVAQTEWRWCRENPVRAVRRPPATAPRVRRISQPEITAMLSAFGYVPGSVPANLTQRVAMVWLFAIETAMRAGEILQLTWLNIDIEQHVATLIQTKNGDVRGVPLTPAAVALLELLPKGGSTCFDVTGAMLDALFRKARNKAGIVDLHFHDSRHEGITRLAQRVPILDLARSIGHRDLESLMIYYNPTTAEIAKRLRTI